MGRHVKRSAASRKLFGTATDRASWAVAATPKIVSARANLRESVELGVGVERGDHVEELFGKWQSVRSRAKR